MAALNSKPCRWLPRVAGEIVGNKYIPSTTQQLIYCICSYKIVMDDYSYKVQAYMFGFVYVFLKRGFVL